MFHVVEGPGRKNPHECTTKDLNVIKKPRYSAEHVMIKGVTASFLIVVKKASSLPRITLDVLFETFIPIFFPTSNFRLSKAYPKEIKR